MGKDRPMVSEAEREVLKVLWDVGPSTVREVLRMLTDQGQQWSRSTVITLLQRLEKKGYVSSDRGGFAFVFQAIVTREEVAQQRLSEVAEELYAGEAAPLVLAFAQRHPFTADEVRQFREMIDQMESERRGNNEKRERTRAKKRRKNN